MRLIALTHRHLVDLEGTEITAAYLTDLKASLAAFEAARSVVHTHSMQVDGPLVATRARRNRAFWALAALDRTVVKRCQFGLRRDPEIAAQFTSYHNALRRRRKAAATPTATPVATPIDMVTFTFERRAAARKQRRISSAAAAASAAWSPRSKARRGNSRGAVSRFS